MKLGAKQNVLIAVEDEPFPRGPTGQSCRLKLDDWLNLAARVESQACLEVCPLSELNRRHPHIVEAFSSRHEILSDTTFPSRTEHDSVGRFSRYWPAVERAGVPAIGVINGEPDKYPVFVRGEEGTFRGGGCVRSAAGLHRLRQSGRALVVRPFVEILAADKRQSVTLELRVHVVAGRAVAVEYLFPPWADQRPTDRELKQGNAWVESERDEAAQRAERIASELPCRWFVADFAGTSNGLMLIELNPGWCAGIAHAEAARAVHAAVLTVGFGVKIPPSP